MFILGGFLLSGLKVGVLIFAVTMCLMLVLPSFQALENPQPVTTRSDKVNAQVYVDPQSTTDSKAYWLNLATNAWQYYQPNNGVNSVTGLESNAVGSSSPQFTDWDLGTYVQAIVEADKLGLSNPQGWDTSSRLNKVLTFLETRPLMANGQPYAWYSAVTGQNVGIDAQVAWDAGNLLVALKNVENYGPTSYLTSRINNIVFGRAANNPTNYMTEAQTAAAVVGWGPDVYHYYLALGFGSFFDNYNGWSGFTPTNFTSEATTILNNIVSSQNISIGLSPPYDMLKLPKADILCEPLLLAIFGSQQPNPALLSFSRQVYLAQEARYYATGKFTAFSEGGAIGQYVYEWIVFSNGATWEVQDPSYNVLSISPVVYLKVAVSFLALYDTPYSQNMVSYLIPKLPALANGYVCGADENGVVVYDIEDKTNSLIISAARYAIDNNVTLPASFTAPSPAQSTVPTSGSSSSSNTGPTVTSNPQPTSSPRINPQQSNAPTIAPSLSTTSPSSSNITQATPTPPQNSTTSEKPSKNPAASESPANTPNGKDPWQTNPAIIAGIVVVVAIAVILPVIILRRNGSRKPQ